MNHLLGFLASTRQTLPAWAQRPMADTERFLASLRGLPRTTTTAILLCTALIYALKAFTMAFLTLLVAAYWLLEKTAANTPGDTPCPPPPSSTTPPTPTSAPGPPSS